MKHKILIIEDDAGINRLICRKMEKIGYECTGLHSDKDLIATIREFEPDLMLLDYQLPGITGAEVLAGLHDKKVEIPFIVITGHGDERVAVEMMKAGAMDYIVKDAEFHSILPQKVSQALTHIDTLNKLRISEDRLAESEAKCKRIIDSMKDPVFICSKDHVIEYENPGLKSYTGQSLSGSKCYKALFNRDEPCSFCHKVNSIEDEFKSYEVTDHHRERKLMISSGPINFTNGKISRLNIIRDITDLVAIKTEAKSNEEKFRLIAENSVDVIWQMSRRLHFIYLSPSVRQILGYEADEMIGKPLWKFARYRAFVGMAREALTYIQKGDKNAVTTFESEMIHKNGTTIPVEISGKLLMDDKGRIVGLQGATRDISERIKNRETIDYHNSLLQTLLDNIPDQVYVKDSESKYLLNNKGHRDELKVTNQEQLAGKTDADFFEKEMADEFYEDEQRIIRSGKPMVNKEEFKSYPDGSYKWTLTTKVPVRNSKNEIVGIAGINRDITDRKEQEEELLRSRYELAFKNRLSNIFLISDNQSVFVKLLDILMNETYSGFGLIGILDDKGNLDCRAVKLISDSLRNRQTEGIIEKSSWTGTWGKALTLQTTTVTDMEEHFGELDITVHNLVSVPIMLGDTLIGFLSVGNKKSSYKKSDIEMLENTCQYIAPIIDSRLKEFRMRQEREKAFEELKAAKDKAEESDRLKSSFLLNLSHELRTPLNSIIGFTNLMTNSLGKEDKFRKYAEVVDLAGQDLIKMVDDTIEISKLESQEYETEMSVVNIIPLIEEVFAEYKRVFAKRFTELEMVLKSKKDSVEVFTDQVKLKKALSKIVDNAGKFTEHGEVEIGISENDKHSIVIYVKDNGIGIPEELQDAVFEKFRKIINKDVLYRGNGLGLSIAKGLVEMIGGNIVLESEVGAGTMVSILLPSGSPKG